MHHLLHHGTAEQPCTMLKCTILHHVSLDMVQWCTWSSQKEHILQNFTKDIDAVLTVLTGLPWLNQIDWKGRTCRILHEL